MRAPGIVHYAPSPDEMLPAPTGGSPKQAGAGNKQGSKQMVLSPAKGGASPQSSLTPESERLKLYRKWYHELDKRRLEMKRESEEDLHAFRIIESEIRCLEELIVLSTELGNICPTPLGVEHGRIVPHQLHPIPGKNKLGTGVETWPADSPIPPVEGLDLSLITDMLMLSATSPWTVYVAERAQWTLCYISPSVKRILGWKQPELVGSIVWDGCHPDDITDVQRMLSDGDKISGRTQIVCYRRMRRNCAYATVQATGRPLGARWYAWVELLISDLGELNSSGSPSPENSWVPPEPILALSPVGSPASSNTLAGSGTAKGTQALGGDHDQGADSFANQSRKRDTSHSQSTSLHRSSFTTSREALDSLSHRRPIAGGGTYSTLPYGSEMLALASQVEKGRLSASSTGKATKALTAAGETGKMRSGSRGVEEEEGESDTSVTSRNTELRPSSRSASERDDSRAILPITAGGTSAKSSLNSEEVENIWREGARALADMNSTGSSHSFPVAPSFSAPLNPPLSVARRRTGGQPAGAPGSGALPSSRARLGSTASAQSISSFSQEDLSLIRGQKVLLVEDDVVNRTIGQRLLESLDCEVTVTCNGMEALKVMQGGIGNELSLYKRDGVEEGEELPPQFDLVLMDLIMPVLDGLGAVERFREWEALQEPKRKRMLIFAVTSNVTDGDMVKCAQSGFDEFVSKPLTMDKLIHRLQGVLKQRSSGMPRSLE